MDLAAGDSHPMVLQRERKERKKLEVVVGTTYRWNTAAALPHTAQRFSSIPFFGRLHAPSAHHVA